MQVLSPGRVLAAPQSATISSSYLYHSLHEHLYLILTAEVSASVLIIKTTMFIYISDPDPHSRLDSYALS